MSIIVGETVVTEANFAVDIARNGEFEGRALRWPMTDVDPLTLPSSAVMPNDPVQRVYAPMHTPFLMLLLPIVQTYHHGPSAHTTKVTSNPRQRNSASDCRTRSHGCFATRTAATCAEDSLREVGEQN